LEVVEKKLFFIYIKIIYKSLVDLNIYFHLGLPDPVFMLPIVMVDGFPIVEGEGERYLLYEIGVTPRLVPKFMFLPEEVIFAE
jgi:hypothetical protein